MFFNKKVKDIIPCYKCGDPSKEPNLQGDYICESCHIISITEMNCNPKESKFDKMRSYIWYYGLEENGLIWYKKAREKLIKEFDMQNKLVEEEENRKRKIIKDDVSRWIKWRN